MDLQNLETPQPQKLGFWALIVVLIVIAGAILAEWIQEISPGEHFEVTTDDAVVFINREAVDDFSIAVVSKVNGDPALSYVTYGMNEDIDKEKWGAVYNLVQKEVASTVVKSAVGKTTSYFVQQGLAMPITKGTIVLAKPGGRDRINTELLKVQIENGTYAGRNGYAFSDAGKLKKITVEASKLAILSNDSADKIKSEIRNSTVPKFENQPTGIPPHISSENESLSTNIIQGGSGIGETASDLPASKSDVKTAEKGGTYQPKGPVRKIYLASDTGRPSIASPPQAAPENDVPSSASAQRFIRDFYTWLSKYDFEPGLEELWTKRQIFSESWGFGAPLFQQMLARAHRLPFLPFTGTKATPKKAPTVGQEMKTGEQLIAIGDNFARDSEVADVRVPVEFAPSERVEILLRQTGEGWKIVDIDYPELDQLSHLLWKLSQKVASEMITAMIVRYCEAYSKKDSKKLEALFTENVNFMDDNRWSRQKVVAFLAKQSEVNEIETLYLAGEPEVYYPSDDYPTALCVFGSKAAGGESGLQNLKMEIQVDFSGEEPAFVSMKKLPSDDK